MIIRLTALLLLIAACAPPQSAVGDETRLTTFFAAVDEGNVDNVMKLMHPELARRIDPPILEAWLQAVAFRLGRVVTILNTIELTSDDRQELSAEVTFTKGIAEAELIFKDNTIVGFEIRSEHLTNWFQRPTSLDLYRRQGEKFLTTLIARDFLTCRQVLHEKIDSQLTDEYLLKSLNTIESQAGRNPIVTYQQARLSVLPDERLKQIDLNFVIEGSQGKLSAEIAIRFHGMQGHLVGFRFFQ